MTQTRDEARHVAARVAARAEILDVRLLKTHGELMSQPEPPLVYRLETDARVEYEDGDASFVVACTYELSITPSASPDVGGHSDVTLAVDDDVEADESPVVAKLSFDYAALISLHMRAGDAPPSQDELQAYAASTGQFALYPYARQYIYDLTGRLGLPPLTVGVLQLTYEPELEDPTQRLQGSANQ